MPDQQVDTETPSVARVYDAMLGGRDNFTVDRTVLDHVVEIAPDIVDVARQNRAWQGRVLRWLVREAGIEQFLDLGSGLPTAENTHQVVQGIAPEAVVVYVDNDPAVHAFELALLSGSDRTHFVDADLTDPARVLADPVIADHLDLGRPAAVILGAMIHHIADDEQARALIAAYVDALAAGSYLALSHVQLPDPADHSSDAELIRDSLARFQEPFPTFTPRTADGIRALLGDLQVLEPGIVPLPDWWPGGPRTGPRPPAANIGVGVLAYKA